MSYDYLKMELQFIWINLQECSVLKPSYEWSLGLIQ